ncbi:hypothetical protein BSKO_03964 [Bryopsis sp. KO-2023]|nr:hypothetical protein BSKO_03964 [Bryopsis sp. KO-2023]
MIESWQFEEVEASQLASGSKPSMSAAFASSEAPPQFDGVSTVVELWQKSARKNRIHPCMGVMMDQHKYSFMSYNEVNHLVRCLSSSLRQVVTKGKNVGIWGENCPAWMLSFLACARSNLCSVLLHENLGGDSVETMLKKSELGAVVISPEKIKKFAALMVKNPGIDLDAVVYWGEELPFYSEVAAQLRQRKITMYNLGEFIEMGEEKNMMVDKSPTPESIATVLYSMGPLGEMEGVTYSHKAIVSSVASIDQHYRNAGFEFGVKDSILSYFPMTHIANIMLDLWFLGVGAKVGYSRGRHMILDDAKVLQPTFFPGNAKILREICNRISKTSGVSGGFRGKMGRFLVSWGYNRKLHFMKNGIPPRHASPLFDTLVFRKSQKVLGGKQRVILVFGDPPSAEVGEILRVCTSAAVHSSLHSMYTTCLTFSGPMNFDNIHTLGAPLPSVALRLQSVPELGHDALGPVPEGEVLIKSPHNFTGFYNNPKLMKELVDEEGWLHTGEIAKIEDNRFVFIGRKTSLYTSKKEPILLEKVEQIYESSNLVEKIWVHPDLEGIGLIGTVVPNERSLAKQAAFQDIDICGEKVEHLRGEQKITDLVLEELRSLGRKSDLKPCEMLTKVVLKTEQEVLLKCSSSSFLSLERGARPDVEVLTAKPRGLSFKSLMSMDMDFSKLMEPFKRSNKKESPTRYEAVF